MNHKHHAGQVYMPRLLTRLFMLGMAIALAGIHLFVFQDVDMRMALASPFLAFTLGLILLMDGWFVWYGLIFMTQTRLIVNADGIELQRGGASLFVAWENISHFGVKGAGKSQHRGVYLYHKVQPEVNGFAERLFFGRATDFVPLGQVLDLPANWGFFKRDINLEKLAQTEFGQDVKQYAGHLLNLPDDKSKGISQRLLAGSRDATYVIGADEQKLRKHH